MASDKYYWRIGSPLPHLDRHSETKHRIVSEYIKRYINTVMSNAMMPALQLSLVDGFCGGGCYQTENAGLADGSPILMMRAVREARALLNMDRRIQRSVNVDYFFIDAIPDTTQYLQFLLKNKKDEGVIDSDDYQRVETITDKYLHRVPYLINKIKAKKLGERALFLLDQYNYDDIPLPSIATLLRSIAGAEVILTFNVGSLVTFLSDRAENRKPMKAIGLDTYIPWQEIKNIKLSDKYHWKTIIQRHLANGIKSETGARFMTLFFVKPFGGNTWEYWLIHLSNHYKAHDVMKNLHWEHATEFGHSLEPGIFLLGYDANKDPSYTQQDAFDFNENTREACVDQVREHFGTTVFSALQPVLVGDLFKSCVSNSMAANSHLLESLAQLHKSKNIIVIRKDGRIRRPSKTYRPDDIVEASKQIILL